MAATPPPDAEVNAAVDTAEVLIADQVSAEDKASLPDGEIKSDGEKGEKRKKAKKSKREDSPTADSAKRQKSTERPTKEQKAEAAEKQRLKEEKEKEKAAKDRERELKKKEREEKEAKRLEEKEKKRKEDEEKKRKQDEKERQQKRVTTFFTKMEKPQKEETCRADGDAPRFEPHKAEADELFVAVPGAKPSSVESGTLFTLLSDNSSDILSQWRAEAKFPEPNKPGVHAGLPEKFDTTIKLLSFYDSPRPAYSGTWQKCSKLLTGRWLPGTAHPRDTDLLQYDRFSEDEWEVESEGEEICGGEEDAADAAEEEEEDDDFVVEDGHLSADEGLFNSDEDEEGAKGDGAPADAVASTRMRHKKRLKKRQRVEFAVRILQLPESAPALSKFAVFRGPEWNRVSDAFNITDLISNWDVQAVPDDKERTPKKKIVAEHHLPELIRLAHRQPKLDNAVNAFFANHSDECSKAQIEVRIREISSREKVGKQYLWMVHADVLAKLTPDLIELDKIEAEKEAAAAALGSPKPKKRISVSQPGIGSPVPTPPPPPTHPVPIPLETPVSESDIGPRVLSFSDCAPPTRTPRATRKRRAPGLQPGEPDIRCDGPATQSADSSETGEKIYSVAIQAPLELATVQCFLDIEHPGSTTVLPPV
eukprot:TRINITY_DN17071_c0_g1_i1.p1 TRINITY_DN17071_c0_g1~~TRINITY_DN17071_c0_g1_i1.p1  ORF type:complete len:657 (-),score=137.03 TRINITY_DN17071_c0_g1_i1:14-1960(-)